MKGFTICLDVDASLKFLNNSCSHEVMLHRVSYASNEYTHLHYCAEISFSMIKDDVLIFLQSFFLSL